jgi:hypothetical protein
VEYGVGFALALTGETRDPRALVEDLEKRFPEDTAARFSYEPTIRGLIALNQGQPLKAIEELNVATPYELGAPPSAFQGTFGTFYPIYVRGLAYLAARKGAQAATEFTKILDHSGIVFNDPVGAAARIQLARSLVVSGDVGKAKTAYQDFLAVWQHADPDVPILRAAKAEYARLK